jgi:hypothetical protein
MMPKSIGELAESNVHVPSTTAVTFNVCDPAAMPAAGISNAAADAARRTRDFMFCTPWSNGPGRALATGGMVVGNGV